MKIKVNRNTVWCQIFTNRLAELGVKHVCISPGSRSTPLTLAFNENKKFSVYPIVDERSSAFFALGIAKQTNTPVAVVTTSGTAVAELYPAIIEAYYQRVPLIICTADRPHSLRGSGANQTINQNNIYKNHIRYFVDAGLPDLKKLEIIKSIAEKILGVALLKDKGPVHINFPFEKPFEPNSYTDSIEESLITNIYKNNSVSFQFYNSKINFSSLAKKFKNKRGLILVGYNNYTKDFPKALMAFSEKFGFPIYADGSNSLRYGKHSKENIIENFTAIIRSNNFQKHFDPEIILQFGNAPTANVILDFYKTSKAEKYLVNEFGDYNDPSLTTKHVLRENPQYFCNKLLESAPPKSINTQWLDDWKAINLITSVVKKTFIEENSFPFEGRIITEIIKSLPDNSNLFISNSLPIRDADFFSPVMNKRIKVFTNRGASGIDGITSTALGIAKTSKLPTYLISGDLAFYHDLNGLHNSLKFNIPITVILINNQGGGIFESLPIAQQESFIKDSFLTPLLIDFKDFIKAYKGKYVKINSWAAFNKELRHPIDGKKITVLELRTDAKRSKLQRLKFWSEATEQIDFYINDILSRRNSI